MGGVLGLEAAHRLDLVKEGLKLVVVDFHETGCGGGSVYGEEAVR